MSSGYVYILSNPSMPGLLKIGRSQHGGSARARQMHTTATPTPFKLEFEVFTEYMEWLESSVHKALSEYRETPGREFFRLSADDAILSVMMHFAAAMGYTLITLDEFKTSSNHE